MKQLFCAAVALACAVGLTGADDKKPAKTGELFIAPSLSKYEPHSRDPADKKFAAAQAPHVGKPVLVSLLRDGKLVRQTELTIDRWSDTVAPFRDLPFGTYTVKFEAPGIQTVVKKGLVVSATSAPIVIADLKAGKGVRQIEYGVEGDPTAALKARVRQLEAELAALRKAK